MTTYLSKEEFWAATRALPAEEVTLVDPHGKVVGKIRMRGLSGAELEAYQESVSQGSGKGVSFKNAMSRLIVLSAINEDGSPFFTKHDHTKISDAPSWMVMQLFQSACRLSGMTESDVKELAENFGETPGEPSPSA